jgi:hypothetical protein
MISWWWVLVAGWGMGIVGLLGGIYFGEEMARVRATSWPLAPEHERDNTWH